MTPSEHENKAAGPMNNAMIPVDSVPPAAPLVPRAFAAHQESAQAAKAQSRAGSALAFDNLLKGFRNRWPTATALGLLLGCAFGAASWYLNPPKYTAFALLRVAPVEPHLLGEARTDASTDQNYQNTQVALIKSRRILVDALRPQKISQLATVHEKEDPVSWLEEELVAGFIDKTDLLRVALSGSNPDDLWIIVNGVTKAFMDHEDNGQHKLKFQQIQDIDKVLQTKEDELAREREKLHAMARDLKTDDSQALTLKQKIFLDAYGTLNSEWTRAEAEYRTENIKLQALEARQKGVVNARIPDYLIDEALEKSGMLQQRGTELKAEESRIMEQRNKTQPGTAKAVSLDEQLKGVQADLKELRSQQIPQIRKRLLDKARDELQAEIDLAKQKVTVAKEQVKVLKEEVDNKRKDAESIGIGSFELEQKKDEVAQTDALVRKLRESKERLQVEMGSSNQRITIQQDAERLPKRNFLPPIKTAAFGGLLGLFLGAFLISYKEARVRRINTADDIAEGLNVRVLGVLPALNAIAHYGTNDAATQCDSLLIESVDGVRAMLLCGSHGDAYRVLMVTSALPREGKTTFASHLAISLARSSSRVLLIDADLRRPTLHQVFEVPMGPGFSDVLRGDATVEQAIRPVAISGLDFMGAGNDPKLAVPLLPREDSRVIFDKLRAMYDLIIVDSSPVLPVADALWLAKRVDGVVLSVRSHTSRAPAVHAAYDRLRSINIPILGAVVNGARNYLHVAGYEYLSQPDLLLAENRAE